MTETPKPEQIVDITGPAGETLFWHTKEWIVAKSVPAIQADLDNTWHHYRDITDDRLVALVAALCVEGAVDALLEAMAPGVATLKNDTDFKFSVKIKFARSLQLLPARVLTACDLVRQIRNEFAHNVALRRFEDLEAKFQNRLAPYVWEFNKAAYDPNAPQRLFKDLVGFILMALRIYTEQVSRLRSYVSTDTGRADFQRWCQAPPDQAAG